MRHELHEALESACSREAPFHVVAPVDRGIPTRWHSLDTVKTLLYNIVRELPDEMTVREIREQLEE